MSTIEQHAVAGIVIAQTAENELAWNKAAECLRKGQSAVQAITQVYNLLTPPRTLDGVAAIIGAVYANDFWANVKMDPELLAKALAQTQLWDIDACRTAATRAFQTWRGLWTRANTAPLGSIPRPGEMLASPDVCSAGPQPLTREALILRWDITPSAPAVVGMNFASVRAQSVGLPLPITRARVRMFWARTSVTVPPVQDWIEMNPADNGDDVLQPGSTPVPIEEGRKVATGPFVFSPSSAGHHCMAALASTEFFKNPVPSGGSNIDYVAWLQNNGAAAWRNVDVSGKVGGSPLMFYNHDDQAERFEFEVRCEGLADGTVVELSAGQPKIRASVSVNGPVQVLSSAAATVAAGFAGELHVSLNGADALPAGAMVEVRALWLLDAAHRHYAKAVREGYATAEAGEPVKVQLGSYTYLGEGR